MQKLDLNHQFRLNDLSGELISIQIDNGRKSRRLLRIVHDLDYVGNRKSGWANGTMRLEAGDIEALYKADLYINVVCFHEKKSVLPFFTVKS